MRRPSLPPSVALSTTTPPPAASSSRSRAKEAPASAAPKRRAPAPPSEPASYTGKEPKIDLLFDSGAFSAWKLGKPIVLDTYCDYLLANKQWMGAYVALDVINPDSPEAAAKASFENYLHMRKRGLDPIPVFHVKEDVKWLYRMIDAGASYIGLSASSLVSRNHVNDWYAQCWNKLTDSKGRPLIKAHAFGEGRYAALAAFPWYSADSTSWIYRSQRNGRLPIWDGPIVSHRNDGLHDKSKQDINSMDSEEAAVFAAYLEKHGVDASVFESRGPEAITIITYLALQYYLEQEKKVTALCPIHHKKGGLFQLPLHEAVAKREALGLDKIRYYSVGGGNPAAYAALAYAGAERMLISYFYIRTISREGGHPRFNVDPLKAFLYDPQGACSTMEPMKKSWDTLSKYIKRN